MDRISQTCFKCVTDLHPLAVGKGYEPPPPPPPPPPPEMDQEALKRAELVKAANKAALNKKRGRARTFLGGTKELEEANVKTADTLGGGD